MRRIPLEQLTARDMVEIFQCPGCTHGADIRCGHFKMQELQTVTPNVGTTPLIGGFRCQNQVSDAIVQPSGISVNLGLPSGFARHQRRRDLGGERVATNIRMHLSPPVYGTYWDCFNVPVWGLEKEGFLFVRTFQPRIDQTYVDIIKGGEMKNMPPTCVNVALLGAIEL